MINAREAARRVTWVYDQAKNIFDNSSDFQLGEVEIHHVRKFFGMWENIRIKFDVRYTGDRTVSMPVSTVVFSTRKESFEICTRGNQQKPTYSTRQNRNKPQGYVLRYLQNLKNLYASQSPQL